MRRFLLLLLFGGVLSIQVVLAQMVIELDNGANVRSKNIRDYDKKVEHKIQERDSLLYIDCLTRGFNALYADSLKEARQFFLEAIKLRPSAPGNYILHRQLAQISEAEGDFLEASKQYSVVLQQHPELHDIRAARASANLQVRHFKQTVDDCNILLKLPTPPVSPERLYFIRASAYMGQHLVKEARMDFERVSLLNPENLNAPVMVALALHDEGRMQEALNRLNLHLQGHPDNVEALLLRAAFEEELGQYSTARADYDKAILQCPERADIYSLRARCLDAMGQKEAAQKDRLRAKQLQRK